MSILFLHFYFQTHVFATPIRSVGYIAVRIELKHWPCDHRKIRITLSTVKMMGRWIETFDWRRWLHGGSDVLRGVIYSQMTIFCYACLIVSLFVVLFIWFVVCMKYLERRVDSNCISISDIGCCRHIEMDRFTKQKRPITLSTQTNI